MNELSSARAVLVLAKYEVRIALRSRFVFSYALALAALTFAVSYFGLAVVEFTGLQQFDRTAVSLVNLVLYVVPLATMLMPVQSLRPQSGASDQLYAQPVSRTCVLFGKVFGLAGAHVAATVIGFGVTGAFIGWKLGGHGLGSYLVLLAFTVLVGGAFISISSLITVLSERGPRAWALVLIAWFALVIAFDLVVIGFSFMLPEGWANRLAIAGVFLNPIDAARVGTLLSISGKELFGAAGAQLVRTLGGVRPAIAMTSGSLALWIVLPLLASAALLRGQDLVDRS